MTDYHGIAPLPVEAIGAAHDPTAETTEAFSDPGLTKLANFLKAVIIAEVGTAFATDFPVVGAVCRKAYPHDPREDLLESNWMPALFCWRGSIGHSRLTDGCRGSTSKVLCFWVFPEVNEEEMATMAPVLNGVATALIKALDEDLGNGRHTSWIDPDEPDEGEDGYDPYAATYGSSILERGGFWRVDVDGDFRFSDVSFARQGVNVTYQAVFWQLDIDEHQVPGTDPNLGNTVRMTFNQPGNDDEPVFIQTSTRSAS